MAFPYTIARMSTPSVQYIDVWWGVGGLEGGAARDCQGMPQHTSELCNSTTHAEQVMRGSDCWCGMVCSGGVHA